MSDIPSAKLKMNNVEIAPDAPLTESLFIKTGANINYLIDTTDTHSSDISAINVRIAQVANSATVGPLSLVGPGTQTLFSFYATGQPIFLYWYGGAMRIKNGVQFRRNTSVIYTSRPVTTLNWTINVGYSYTNSYTAPGGEVLIDSINPFLAEDPAHSAAIGANYNNVVGPVLLYTEKPSANTAITYDLNFLASPSELILGRYLLIF